MEETAQEIKRPFGIPEKPEFTVGLDVPLKKLKLNVLSEGSSVIVLTGLGGSGKTTLATVLCWDEQVLGKFKENILFVTFSKAPQLKIIVERLLEHFGYQVPELQSDGDAIDQLVLLLRKINANPMLLVLDDVWPCSEAVVEKLKFQISDYKILVTSRIAFPRFGTSLVLKPLVPEDAITLFRHHAFLKRASSNIPEEDLVQKVVRHCKGLPLAIKVIGRSLSQQSIELWQKMVEELSEGHCILDSNSELLSSLQKILDVLEDNPIIKECFMDLALFPEHQRIPVAALVDMWVELYGLDNYGIKAIAIVNRLDSMNLANVTVTRKNSNDTDSYYYNNHFIVLHDILRDLAIYQSNKAQIELRKRLMIGINETKPEVCLGEKQHGRMIRTLSNNFRLCDKQKTQKIPVGTLSISSDETCTSYWSHLRPAQAEVLILNIPTNQYSIPKYLKEMSKLKVLIVMNYGFHPCELFDFELLGTLSLLKRLRLERISIPSFVTLKNLKKLSLYLCDTREAFENSNILISDAFPNLEDLNIEYSKEMVGLPKGLCNITSLNVLSISNCHKLSALPQEIGNLENLKLLRLSSCTDLQVIPNSVGRLSNLRHMDISNCINLPNLPEEFGNLCNLRTLYMTSCERCELPSSIINLKNLKEVVCDEETAFSWEAFKPMLPNLKIDVPQLDINLNWLHAIHS
ncbi:probable disease resistance protein At5g66900 [Vigna radiata var. radiata]|uniref:Probable disease resistance protein At5g66900 n=1 Tax=Vigna radiata var. radiata TaxID=3916 RepID=A0A1S3UKC1_VIGRR|nr:probable disease resistance protein At5g66900 [Vigna radiata var. radiata]XP_022639044.1 probable disease resistance protein At5g66900 [Vigna radiata var. radiata]